VTRLSLEEVCNEEILSPERFALYVIPQATDYPGEGEAALRSFLSRQGKLMVLGAPAFTDLLWQHGQRWLDSETLRQETDQVRSQRTLLSFEEEGVDPKAWPRGTDDPQRDSGVQLDLQGHEGTCLRYWTENLAGWDTFLLPVGPSIFEQGHDLLCFWAKGDSNTPQCALEIMEEDGSRWIAVVPLRTQWTHHVLSPSEFHYWPDSKTGETRGGPQDRLLPSKACRMVLGLARSHVQSTGEGPHVFWVDEIGTAPDPFAAIRGQLHKGYQAIETVTPSYKLYKLDQIASVQMDEGQRFLDAGRDLSTPLDLYSAIARPSGQGYQQNSPWRWIPLVHALDDQGMRRGTPVWMIQFNAPPFKGACILSVAVNDSNLLDQEDWLDLIADCACVLDQKGRLTEAGAVHFAYWPGEPILLGAKLFEDDLLPDPDLRLSIEIRLAGRKRILFKRLLEVASDSREKGEVQDSWTPSDKTLGLLDVSVCLMKKNRVLDEIQQPVRILRDRTRSEEEFVSVEGSQFILAGKPWNPVGINYWPLYVSGQDPDHYWMGWLEPGLYAPNEVERDLKLMEALGINMVSIQMGRLENHRNLLDFFDRCESHGIKVNGFLGAASPLAFDEDTVRILVETSRLKDNPTLFAYDIIWEPGNYVFNRQGRDSWDADWKQWILERYGSLARAERDWDMPCPTRESEPTSPTDLQMREDGSWRIMVAAYRRFMDDLMSRKWNDATRRLRSIDPHHLVSFRQGNTLPHDFTLTATPKHIDFICPEGYSIPHSEDGSSVAGFITRYVDFTSRGKPVLWSEFGSSVWDSQAMSPSEESILRQAEYHRLFYDMVLDSGAHGTAPWWWPGGYRVNERSDFGIVNMDGTFRPAARLIEKYAPLIQGSRTKLQPSQWLSVDRDAHPGGYWHMAFHEGKDAYSEAREGGRVLGLKTDGTGTTSLNTPMVAVGNVPCDGNNPHKYLNAEFNWVRLHSEKGSWVEVSQAGDVKVSSPYPWTCHISLGNLGEATWIAPETGAPDTEGTVYLCASWNGKDLLRIPIPMDTPYLSDVVLEPFVLPIEGNALATFQLEALGRTRFGEIWTFHLRGE